MELPVLVEEAIEEHERNFVFAVGEAERLFGVVADHEESEEPRVLIEPFDPHRVVVVPEQRGVLTVRIVKRPPSDRARTSLPDGHRSPGEPSRRARAPPCARRLLGVRAVEAMVDGQEVLVGELVDPLDKNTPAAARLDCGTGHDAARSPTPSPAVRRDETGYSPSRIETR